TSRDDPRRRRARLRRSAARGRGAARPVAGPSRREQLDHLCRRRRRPVALPRLGRDVGARGRRPGARPPHRRGPVDPAPRPSASGRGVMVSMDGGATFAGPGRGLPAGDVLSIALSSFFAADPVLFAGVGHLGVFRSADGGATWSQAGLSGQRVGDLVWLGPFLYAATDGGVQRSEDLGRTWLALGQGLEERAVRRLLFPLAPDSGAEVFAATDQGVWRSADG